MLPLTPEEILDKIEKNIRELINVKNYKKLFFDIEIDHNSIECNYGYVDNNNEVHLDHARKTNS